MCVSVRGSYPGVIEVGKGCVDERLFVCAGDRDQIAVQVTKLTQSCGITGLTPAAVGLDVLIPMAIVWVKDGIFQGSVTIGEIVIAGTAVKAVQSPTTLQVV